MRSVLRPGSCGSRCNRSYFRPDSLDIDTVHRPVVRTHDAAARPLGSPNLRVCWAEERHRRRCAVVRPSPRLARTVSLSNGGSRRAAGPADGCGYVRDAGVVADVNLGQREDGRHLLQRQIRQNGLVLPERRQRAAIQFSRPREPDDLAAGAGRSPGSGRAASSSLLNRSRREARQPCRRCLVRSAWFVLRRRVIAEPEVRASPARAAGPALRLPA
jgi:hypothetical protein